MSKIVAVKTGSLSELSTWIKGGAKFFLKCGEAFSGRISWSQRQPVALEIFENKGLTWRNNPGYPYLHYDGGCVWARRVGSEHKIALFVDKTSFKKPRKRPQRQPVTPASNHFKVNDVVICGNHWRPSTFVQITSVSSQKGVVTGRVLNDCAGGVINRAQLNLFCNDKEHRFVTHGNTVCLRKVAPNPTNKRAKAEKREVSNDGYFYGYEFSEFLD